jgi:hypothetical protein
VGKRRHGGRYPESALPGLNPADVTVRSLVVSNNVAYFVGTTPHRRARSCSPCNSPTARPRPGPSPTSRCRTDRAWTV